MIKIITVLILFSNFCASAPVQKVWEFPAKNAETLSIRTDGADMVFNADEDKIKVETIGEYDENLCESSGELKDKTVNITLKSRKTAGKWYLFWKSAVHCKAGLKITAPSKKAIKIKSGAGNVSITGFSNGAAIETGAGDLKFSGFSGPLKIDSGAGSVKGDLYSEDLDIETGAGNVELKWNSAPEKGLAKVRSGAGNVELSFPEAAKMGILHKSGAGNFDTEFGNDSKADFRVEFRSGAGNLKLKKY